MDQIGQFHPTFGHIHLNPKASWKLYWDLILTTNARILDTLQDEKYQFSRRFCDLSNKIQQIDISLAKHLKIVIFDVCKSVKSRFVEIIRIGNKFFLFEFSFEGIPWVMIARKRYLTKVPQIVRWKLNNYTVLSELLFVKLRLNIASWQSELNSGCIWTKSWRVHHKKCWFPAF